MQMDRFTVKAQEALQSSQKIAGEFEHAEMSIDHLALALIRQEDGVVPSVLQKMGVIPSSVESALESDLENEPSVTDQPTADIRVSRELKQVFDSAENEAENMDDEYVSTEHFLLAILDHGESNAANILTSHGADKDSVMKSLQQVRGSQRVTDQNPEEKYETLEKYGRDLTKEARQGDLDPVIGRDDEIRRLMQILSRRTKNNPVLIGEPGVGKTAIVEGMARRIVEGDVPTSLENKRLISLDVSSMVAGSKYRGEFEDRMKAFIKEVTESDGEIVLFIDELHTVVGAGGAEGSVDASNMLKPPLARGELRAIGATTLDEYKKHIEEDAALERRFQKILIEEPSQEETISILRGLQERYEVHHGVRIQDEALVQAAQLSDRYISDRFLPDKAIDLIDEAASALRIEMDSMPAEIDQVERQIKQLEMEKQALEDEEDESAQERLERINEELADLRERSDQLKSDWQTEKEILDRISDLQEEVEQAKIEQEQHEREGDLKKASEIQYGKLPELEEELEEAQQRLDELQENTRMLKEEVTAEDIADVVSRWTGIPVNKLLESEKEKLLHMEDRLSERVVSQDEAIEAVSDAVRRARSDLQDPNRPIGSFIFMGPTGVGKTELAKSLAEFLFDDEDNLIRVDMSEFMEKHSVSRFMGAPPGYVGHEEGGYLTEQVRRKPYSVILFDEIEKAHKDVFNAMLQILDDGRMTDGQGRTVDFRNTVLIMTSNVGSEYIQEAFEEHPNMEHGDPEYQEMREKVMESLRSGFRPEFLNRIDETIIFHSLSRDDIKEIVDIQVDRLLDRIEQQDFDLVLTDRARSRLAEEGYDPVYGARPLQRVIQKRVVNKLAKKVLAGEYEEGVTFEADYDPDLDEFVFNAVQAEEPQGPDPEPATAV
ncbi:MAG: ATP-dependent chaperone ClpB [bacterium]